MTEMKKFQKALETIATVWTEIYEHEDRASGVVEERNRLGFIQDKLLNGIAYQLANALEYTEQTTLPRAKAAVQRALRAHDGTEVAEGNLQAAVDWIQRLTDQASQVSEALDIAKLVYVTHTGKDFSYGRRTAPLAGSEGETPAMAAARALGVVGNTAPGFGSAEVSRSQPIERLPDQHGRERDRKAQHEAHKRSVIAKRSAELDRQGTASAMNRADQRSAKKLAVTDDLTADDETIMAGAMRKAMKG